MSEIAPLKSKIFRVGTKFVVLETTKDSSLGPGTTGFISYVKGRDQDFANVVYLRIVVIKRGKSGKERLEVLEISTPIFDFEDEGLAKVMPDERRKYYVHIEPILNKTIYEMSEIDFLAWAHAYTMYIHKLSTRSKHVNAWPDAGDHILNKMLNICDYYSESPDFVKEEYSKSVNRETFITYARAMESTLVKCSLLYMLKVVDLERKAINNIQIADPKIGDKSIMKATQNFYDIKKDSLFRLEESHGKGDIGKELIDVIRNVLS